jgi:hypothetical protein
MAIQKINNAILYGLAADSKPTTYANNTLWVEQDTGIIYRWNLGTTTRVVLIGAAKTEIITNKTFNLTNNTLTDTSTAAGDLIKSDGTKYTRFARGSTGQFLVATSGDIQWQTIVVYTEAKGTSTQSGDASTLTFNIAHGLGSTPSFAVVEAGSSAAISDYYITKDATNLTVNYLFSPASGTNNLVFNWRAAV